MCGIVAAVANHHVLNTLVQGLQRLEYRGYDSAGVAVLNDDGQLTRVRKVGKVAALEAALAQQPALAKWALPIPAWPPMAASAMRTRTCRANTWPWCTMALLKTMKPYANS